MLQSTEIEFSSVCHFDKIESRGQVLKIQLFCLFCFGSSLSLTPKRIFGIRDISELQISSLCDLHVILYVYISTQKGIDWESVKLASGVIKIDEL